MLADKKILQYRGSYITIAFGPEYTFAGTLNGYDPETNIAELENRGGSVLVCLDRALAIILPVRQAARNSFHPAHRK